MFPTHSFFELRPPRIDFSAFGSLDLAHKSIIMGLSVNVACRNNSGAVGGGNKTKEDALNSPGRPEEGEDRHMSLLEAICWCVVCMKQEEFTDVNKTVTCPTDARVGQEVT